MSPHDLREIIVPCVMFGVPMLIPITAIITKHQRRMAEIKAQTGTVSGNMPAFSEIKGELEALQREVASSAGYLHHI